MTFLTRIATLLQVVYKSNARKHFLADKWMDALHAEMQDLLMRCRCKVCTGTRKKQHHCLLLA